ncbi:MAG: cupredoxin domain-containing protein [Candidatus Paceibacterota bacterium]|jgi:heme/copper-type cytochrome/quinol oxidase subunit 2
MDQKQIKIIIGVAVVVVVGALLAIGSNQGWFGKTSSIPEVSINTTSTSGINTPGTDAFRPEEKNALPTVEGGTRIVSDETIKTPEVGASTTPKDVAVPTNVLETGPSAFRQFEMKGEGGKYVPSTLVVNEGDVIDINFTAVDAKYNVFFPDFGVYRTIEKGASMKIQFQGYPFGKYGFYCKDICGKDVVGTLIVNKK